VQSTVSLSTLEAGCAWSWQGLSIPSHQTLTVEVVFQFAVMNSSPVLTVRSALINITRIYISGNISNATLCTIYVIIDDDLSQILLVGSDVGPVFDLEAELPSLVTFGRKFMAAAVDEGNGRISDGMILTLLNIESKTPSRSLSTAFRSSTTDEIADSNPVFSVFPVPSPVDSRSGPIPLTCYFRSNVSSPAEASTVARLTTATETAPTSLQSPQLPDGVRMGETAMALICSLASVVFTTGIVLGGFWRRICAWLRSKASLNAPAAEDDHPVIPPNALSHTGNLVLIDEAEGFPVPELRVHSAQYDALLPSSFEYVPGRLRTPSSGRSEASRYRVCLD
jgi:hypothetical protein